MAPTIRLLDDTLIDQIAAGEVIERPANLVKELVENSIDAGATAITVSVEDGGRSRVRVSDDGIGMSPEDAVLCIERHATSKIASFDDLVRVATLGFRGEALPSIGSVSRMTLATRRKEDLEGTRVVVEGGVRREVGPAGCPPGTTVEVEDLFYNVPARKKFLRARQTETSRIFEVCQRLALSKPELRLVVISEGRTARQYLPAAGLPERAYQVLGNAMLREIEAERDGVKLEAALGAAELARPGARHLFLLVNGRPVVDRGLARAVAFAYAERLPAGCFPPGVVSLRLAPEEVDVNAHPQKTEVRFKRAAQVADLVTRMIGGRFGAAAPDAYWQARIGAGGPTVEGHAGAPRGLAGKPSVEESQAAYEARSPNGLRFVSQVRDRVIVCEAEDELLVLDRALAEALVRYDALREAANGSGLAPKSLLFPDRIELATSAAAMLERHGDLLRALGFDWSELGAGSYVVRAAPALMADARAASIFEEALSVLARGGTDPFDAVLRALAHRAATPNGQPLDDGAARRIASGIWPARTAHRSCVIGRVSLPSAATETTDA